MSAATSVEPVPSVFDAVKQYGLRLEARKVASRDAHRNSPRKDTDGKLKFVTRIRFGRRRLKYILPDRFSAA